MFVCVCLCVGGVGYAVQTNILIFWDYGESIGFAGIRSVETTVFTVSDARVFDRIGTTLSIK